MTDFALPQLTAQAAPEFTDAKSARTWLEHVPLANLGGAQQRPEVGWVLEILENQDQRRLTPPECDGRHLGQVRPAARLDLEQDPLGAGEAGQGGETTVPGLRPR